MSDFIEIPLDPLGEHIRNILWGNLEEELGLKSCEQGIPEQLAAPEDLVPISPAIFVRPPVWKGGTPEDGMPAIRGKMPIRIAYVRKIAHGEEHPREINQDVQRITRLFSLPDFSLLNWDNSTGLEVEKIYVADAGWEADIEYEDTPIRLALGGIDLVAEVTAYLAG